MTAPSRIAAVAFKLPGSALVISLPRPARHHHIIQAMTVEGLGGVRVHRSAQGFITDDGKFVDRETAWEIAEAAGQILRTTGSAGTLYSEDLW